MHGSPACCINRLIGSCIVNYILRVYVCKFGCHFTPLPAPSPRTQENVTLLKEVNDLRKELKISRSQVHDLDAALKILQKGTSEVMTRTATSQVPVASVHSGLIQPEPAPNDQGRILDMQRAEISKLRARIRELETGRPHSGTRLPPMGAQAVHVS